MNKSAANTIANLASRVWSIISTYIFIPLYIKYLGETTYGLVSFFATLQGALTLLGLGLSSTLRREFAIGEEDYENRKRKHLLLRSTENIYVIIAVFIMLICFFGSDFISTKWLNIEELDPRVCSTAISLMGVSIGLQLISNLWFGCILGLGDQVFANGCTVGWAAIKSVGSVIISILTRNIVLFYSWHIISDILYLIVLRRFISKRLNIHVKWKISDLRNIKTIWKYALGLFAISIIALVTKQFDKALISKYLTLSELGAYNLATTLGGLSIIFASALSVASLTEFTQMVSTKRTDDLNLTFSRYNTLVATVIVTMGVFIATFATDIIRVWTNNEHYINIIKDAAPLVVMALVMIGLQEIPYSLVLAYGNTKINNIVGIASLPMIIVVTYWQILKNGVYGAGLAYIITMAIQTMVYLLWIYKKYMPSLISKLMLKGLILPLTISFSIAFVSKSLISTISSSSLITVLLAIVIGALTLAIEIMLFGRDSLKLFRRKNS